MQHRITPLANRLYSRVHPPPNLFPTK